MRPTKLRRLACLPRLAIVSALLAVASAAAMQPAAAATFTVTKTADTADGACDADCSLREAIIAANALAGVDTIVVPSGTYVLMLAGAGEDAGATGDLDVTDDVIINGAGSATPSSTATPPIACSTCAGQA